MGMVMYACEFKTKGKQKLIYIKKLPDLRESKKVLNSGFQAVEF